MILIHKVCNLSDAIGGVSVGERQPTGFELLYNFAMVILFFLGIIGFLLHAAILARRGLAWLVLKLAALALGWYILLQT